MRYSVVPFCALIIASSALAQDLHTLYNTLATQANVAMKILRCVPMQEVEMCETTGTRLTAFIFKAKSDNRTQYQIMAPSKEAPTGSDLYVLGGAYSILVLIADPSLKSDAIVRMASSLTKQAIETKKEAVVKMQEHIYSANFANLTQLGVGNGYMLSYTAR